MNGKWTDKAHFTAIERERRLQVLGFLQSPLCVIILHSHCVPKKEYEREKMFIFCLNGF
jgi:hypothetical protein